MVEFRGQTDGSWMEHWVARPMYIHTVNVHVTIQRPCKFVYDYTVQLIFLNMVSMLGALKGSQLKNTDQEEVSKYNDF